MNDIVNPQIRSRMMSGIRSKNTKPELELRRALHSRGFRFRLHSQKLCGRPDIILPKYRAVILVHGCFWHRHERCRYAIIPSTRSQFWQAKFEKNVARDMLVRKILLQAGWRVATVWECALRKQACLEASVNILALWIMSEEHEINIGPEELQVSS